MSRFRKLTPRIAVTDLERALGFYCQVLDFRAVTLWPKESPMFAIIERDGVSIGLYVPDSGHGRPGVPGATELHFDVENATELHDALVGRVAVEWGPEVYFYHRREFACRDPDGHLVIFSEETDDPAAPAETWDAQHGTDATAFERVAGMLFSRRCNSQGHARGKTIIEVLGLDSLREPPITELYSVVQRQQLQSLRSIADAAGEPDKIAGVRPHATRYRMEAAGDQFGMSDLMDSVEDIKARLCTSCSKPDAGLRCSRCRKTRYCDAECQRKHWPEHKKHCVRVVDRSKKVFTAQANK
ncbi:Glyoxalase/Bleomycin resistance protein/Dihydroxybiphenyl dioxygenase [Hyaloraphidium curvatum]|nr:Glyoxalase/Bleomycin resistance protein/Dihydroxybiphenyl dioxygenase [Hyaloraphidium curvatum]